MIWLAVILSVSFAADPHSRAGPAGESAVISTRIVQVSTTQPVLLIETAGGADATARDQLFVRGADPLVYAGTVIVTSGRQIAGRVESINPIQSPRSAVVLKAARIASLRHKMPPGATLAGRIARLPPGRTSAWSDLGRLAGLEIGDHLLVRRETLLDGRRVQIPIARGQVLVIDENTSLISLQPLVGNAVAEIGDHVELWPAPGLARSGRINSAVLALKPDSEGDILTVVGSLEDGFVEGRLLDISRGSRFIGVASVIDSGPRPLARARMINTASLDHASEADTAILRAPPGPPNQPLLAPVFRIVGDYCLVAAGEVDGLQRGEKLVVSRQDPDTSESFPVCEITIDKVNMDYAGGFARRLDAAATPLHTWELAERRLPPWPRWQPAGIVSTTDPSTRVIQADIDPKCAVQPGDVIELAPGGEQSPGAAIVLWRLPDRCIAAIPAGWGDPMAMGHAQVLVPEVPRQASRPGP